MLPTPIGPEAARAQIAPGHGSVRFSLSRARTIVARVRAEAPLKLLTPDNHGLGAWVFAATFGGGLVEGDAIDVDVDVDAGATGLLASQASTKVYRCSARTSRQTLSASVADGALLVVIPDPVACFAGARYEQRITVDLAPTASVILVDAFTAGRIARGERWDFARYASRLEIRQGGVLRLCDPIVLDPEHGDLRARMGRFDAFATVVLAGPRARAFVPVVPAEPPPRSAQVVESQSPLGGGDAILRVSGTGVEAVSAAVRRRLSGLGAVLGDDPFARKW